MKQTDKPVIFGIALTVLFHGGLAFYTVHSGLKYIYPPPEEKAITMEFPPEEEMKPVELGSSEELRSPEPEPELPENPVKKAEAPVKVEEPKPNEVAESTVADDGDVEKPEPVKPKEINRRALFSAADNHQQKDTLAPQVARDASDEMSEGHSHGITPNGPADGTPHAQLYGREPVGDLPLPSYDVQDRGMITVFIWVNHDGKVERADIDVQHTNISSAVLREAAKEAARAARFTPVAAGQELQKGSITYIFKLR